MSKKLSPAQKTFNRSYRHLMKQGKKSLDSRGVFCMYRGVDNTRCAAGPLIYNHQYQPSMERQTIKCFGDILEKNGFDYKVAQALQRVHDGHPVKEWKDQLERVAREYNLTIPKV